MVLMLAWMDEEARRLTVETGEAHFFSRSRQPSVAEGRDVWEHALGLVQLKDDCDGDAVLLRVDPAGPACHTGSLSCFAPWLWRRVAERAQTRPEGLDVARLLEGGPVATCAQKLGEEGVEAALATVTESDERLARRARRPLVRELRRARGARPRPRLPSRTSSRPAGGGVRRSPACLVRR